MHTQNVFFYSCKEIGSNYKSIFQSPTVVKIKNFHFLVSSKALFIKNDSKSVTITQR